MSNSASAKDKIERLRQELKNQGIDGFLVPRADEFQGEEVPACAERLAWLTGFTGSAGAAVVMNDVAAVFSDGRYTLQMEQQVDTDIYETVTTTETPIIEWLAANVKAGAKLAYDPTLHTIDQISKMKVALSEKNIELIAIDQNPVDQIWEDRPEKPMAQVTIFDEKVAGKSSAQKREDAAKAIQEQNGASFIFTMPDSIAWLLNIRGGDNQNTPVALSYAVLHENGNVDWYIEKEKLTPDVIQHLGNHVSVYDPDALEDGIRALATKAESGSKAVFMDYRTGAQWFQDVIHEQNAKTENMNDPVIVPRARKTAEEQNAIRDAHVRDGVALARFLKWIDDEAPQGQLTEIDVVDKLEEFRQAGTDYTGKSFDTISGWNANGAIVHYRVDEGSNARIKPPGLLLVDSGGQYKNGGTTDITRTISVGEPTQSMKEHFTKALKGHIAIARMKFPEGTAGHDIDAFARTALWQHGEDFAHGTGHGVGCYLAVHENGVGISTRSKDKFQPGMFVSNEPGYYKTGEYGIRIENLVFVQKDGKMEDGKRMKLCFETVSLAPIDRRLIVKDMLNPEELDWLNDYHANVYKTLESHLEAEPDVQSWLKKSCAPI